MDAHGPAWPGLVPFTSFATQSTSRTSPARVVNSASFKSVVWLLGLAIALALKASLLDTFIGARATTPAASSGMRPWSVGLNVLASYALVPELAFGAGLELQRSLLRNLAARFAIVGFGGPDRTFPQAEGGFDAWLLTSRLDLCTAFELAAGWQLSACLGVALGSLFIHGRGLSDAQTKQARFIALGGSLERPAFPKHHVSG